MMFIKVIYEIMFEVSRVTNKSLPTFVQFRLKPYLVTYFSDSLQCFDKWTQGRRSRVGGWGALATPPNFKDKDKSWKEIKIYRVSGALFQAPQLTIRSAVLGNEMFRGFQSTAVKSKLQIELVSNQSKETKHV